MGFYRGPQIVTDGLILNLDAGNTKSYSSGASSFLDRSGLRNNGVLVGGATFSSVGNGTLLLNGSTDYVQHGNVMGGLSSYSVEYVFRANIDLGGREMWVASQYDGTLGRLIFDINATSKLRNFIGGTSIASTTTILTNTWYHVVFTRNSVGYATIYINGIIDGSGTISAATTTSTNYNLGGTSIPARCFGGNIAINRVYRKALSQDEIVKNFNSNKSRFGL